MSRDSRISAIRGGKCLATDDSAAKLRKAIASGTVTTKVLVVGAQTRLDQLAWQIYGDSQYWWLIAAASGIGWGLQIPEGTRVVFPANKIDALAVL